MKTVLELETKLPYRGGERNVGKVSTLGRITARILRNLGETSCEDTIFSPYSSSKCSSSE